MNFEAVIGLEVHAELKTKSKIFCSCTTRFGGEPNTHICPVCLGLPGSLPVINRRAIEYAIKAALALNCKIAPHSKFDRKNYYYPDLPKNYQISQYDLPLALDGYLEIELNGKTKRVRITRLHLEEDAGKLIHGGASISRADYSLVDYNRTGVPLIEIVSEPDMNSPEEARAYLDQLKAILQYTEVSDCKMQEGSLRCDANVSIRPRGSAELGTKTELKNMNSFKALQKALEYEIERQTEVLEENGTIIQETRTWDEREGVTLPLRSKEEAHDYRYFPEPDLVPLSIDRKRVEEIRAGLPELPQARKKRLIEDFKLPEYDAKVLTLSKHMAEYFDSCVKETGDAKLVSNWLMGDFSRLLNSRGMEVEDSPVPPKEMAFLLKLIKTNKISGKIGKKVLEEMFETGKGAQTIIRDKGMEQISDEKTLIPIIEKVLEVNAKTVEDYRKGKERALGFLVGQVMKKTKGKANPELVNKLLKDRL